MKHTAIVLAGVAVAACAMTAQAVVIEDFSGGVTHVNHPEGAGVDATWYDITNDTFGGSAAGTLAASDAMNVTDGGFTNGVYAIYSAVVPANGVYTLSADILVNDTETSDIANFQIGAEVNGAHRGLNPSDLPHVSNFGSYTGLNADVLDATVIQNVTTNSFSANAGDSILVAFGTNLNPADGVDYDVASGFWNGATVDVDNIKLNLVPEPASLALVGIGALAMLRRR